eukprot:IDg1998t1
MLMSSVLAKLPLRHLESLLTYSLPRMCAVTWLLFDVRENAKFVPQTDVSETILSFLTTFVQDKKASAMALISRGQIRAHDFMQRDVVSVFYQLCLLQSPLWKGSLFCEADFTKHVKELLINDKYKTSRSFDDAWFFACITLRSKASSTAIAVTEDIRKICEGSVAVLSSIWAKDENDVEQRTISMSICAFAFIVTKVWT